MNFCNTALPNKFASCGTNYDNNDDKNDGKILMMMTTTMMARTLIDYEDQTYRNNGQEGGVENDHLNSEN